MNWTLLIAVLALVMSVVGYAVTRHAARRSEANAIQAEANALLAEKAAQQAEAAAARTQDIVGRRSRPTN